MVRGRRGALRSPKSNIFDPASHRNLLDTMNFDSVAISAQVSQCSCAPSGIFRVVPRCPSSDDLQLLPLLGVGCDQVASSGEGVTVGYGDRTPKKAGFSKEALLGPILAEF